MIRPTSRWTRTLLAGVALCGLAVLPTGALAKPPSAVAPRASQHTVEFQKPPILTPAPDLTLRIKHLNCHEGHVAVKIRLQDLNSGPVVVPITTTVNVGGQTASQTFPASSANPWWNGQDIGFNLFPGAGVHAVNATVSIAADTDPSNNQAPSASNSFDSNPVPLSITCEGNGLQKLPREALPFPSNARRR